MMLVLDEAIVHISNLVCVGGRALCKQAAALAREAWPSRLACQGWAGVPAELPAHSMYSAALISHALVLLPPTSNTELALVPQ